MERRTSLAKDCFHRSLASGISGSELADYQSKGSRSRPWFARFRQSSSSTSRSSWCLKDMEGAHSLTLQSRVHCLYRCCSLRLSWRASWKILSVYSLSAQALFQSASCTFQVFSSSLSQQLHSIILSGIYYRWLSCQGCSDHCGIWPPLHSLTLALSHNQVVGDYFWTLGTQQNTPWQDAVISAELILPAVVSL